MLHTEASQAAPPYSGAAASPPSGHQQVEDELQREALALYGLDAATHETTWMPTVGGVNNVTRRIIVRRRKPQRDAQDCDNNTEDEEGGPSSIILRVYRNNNDTRRVAMEHLVLAALQPFNGGSSTALQFQFATPQPMPSLAGAPFEVLSNGACCCVFACIPGTLASRSAPQAVGAAAGTVARALAMVSDAVRQQSGALAHLAGTPAPPYHDLWAVHHAIGSRDAFNRIVRAHSDDIAWFATNALSADWAYILRKLDGVEQAIAELRRLGPDQQARTSATTDPGMREQLIHGDLHYDNVLMMDAPTAEDVPSGGRAATQVVTGVLDFEFVAFDWRPMELSICLSKYLGEDDPMVYCRPFVRGYLHACAPEAALSTVERNAVPQCIALRILSNVVYFVGRAVSGEDTIDALTTRVGSYRKRLMWLEENANALVAAMEGELHV